MSKGKDKKKFLLKDSLKVIDVGLFYKKLNKTASNYAGDKSLKDLFETQARKTPNNNAIIFDDKIINYKSLNEKANRLAYYLVHEQKMKKGQVLAMYMEKSPDAIASVLAILKVGGACLPIHTKNPIDRICKILKDAKCKLVLTDTGGSKKLKAKNFSAVSVINIEKFEKAEYAKLGNPANKVKSRDLAFIMYTSGSSGEAKGVQVEHRGVINYVSFLNKKEKINSRDACLQLVPLAFDPVLRDIFCPLLSGAAICLVPDSKSSDYRYIGKLIEKEKTTMVLSIIPVFLDELIDHAKANKLKLKSLRLVATCGEVLSVKLKDKMLSFFDNKISFLNQYGPTECTMIACCHKIEINKKYKGLSVPIGKPIANTQVYILDKNLQLLPPGKKGEIYIAGDGLSRGYIVTSKNGNKSFIRSPFDKKKMIYRTGDLGKLDADGNIYFMGRADDQFKIRGYRIEPIEIANAIKEYPGVKDCVVTQKKGKINAFIVKKSNINNETLTEAERQRYSRQLLIENWGERGQLKIKNTVVFVAGAGGSGSAVLMQLTQLGFGKIIICDFDSVELSNLNRQFLHTEARVGMNKALSARKTLKEINPNLEIIACTDRITAENAEQLMASADIVFDCVDDVATKFNISKFTSKKNIPHIISSMMDINSYAIIFHTPHTPCFSCLYDNNSIKMIESVKNLKKETPNPVACTSLFISAGFACNEAIKIVLGHINIGYNKFFLFNQAPVKDIVNTIGYKKIIFPFNDHFKKISKQQGFDWENGFESSNLDEINIRKNHKCTVCASSNKQKKTNSNLVSKKIDNFDKTLLKQYLAKKLPQYMIPNSVIVVCQFPLNKNGKIDKKSLPEAGENDMFWKTYRQPKTETEILIEKVWKDELGVGSVGLNDDFFDIGGHSLNAIQATTKLNDVFGTDISLKDFYGNSVLKKMAIFIDSAEKGGLKNIDIITPATKKYFNLSYAQTRMWLLYRLDPSSPYYNMSQGKVLFGEVDRKILEKSINHLVGRHEVLRTNFVEINGLPMQKIASLRSMSLVYHDLTKYNKQRAMNEKERLIESITGNKFILEKDKLIRVLLIREKQNKDIRHTLIVVMHHIISDGWSMDIFFKELSQTYEFIKNGAKSNLLDQNITYKDYAEWERSQKRQEYFKESQKYWLAKFSGQAGNSSIPADKKRPLTQRHAGKYEYTELSNEETEKLRELCRENNVTMFTLLFGLFNIFLYRVTGNKDIIIGTPSANRNNDQIKDLMGIFINILPIRSRLNNDLSIKKAIEDINNNVIDVLSYQDIPFEYIIEKIHPKRSSSHATFVSTMFQFDSEEAEITEFAGIKSQKIFYYNNTAKFDVRLRAKFAKGNKIEFQCEYDSDIYSQELVSRLLGSFMELIKNSIGNTAQSIASVNMISRDDERRNLVISKGKKEKYPQNDTLVSIFEKVAKRSPNRTAVQFENEKISYRTLSQKANLFADSLMKKGVKRGDVVAVRIKRNLEMIIAVLAIHKTGSSCLMLDMNIPETRIRHMLADSGTKYLVRGIDSLKRDCPKHIEEIIINSGELMGGGNGNINFSKNSDSAFVVYTSGSTGKPKGVLLTHKNVVCTIYKRRSVINFKQSDVFCLSLATGFVPMTFNLYSPLLFGAKLVVYNDDTIRNIIELFEKANKDRISILDVGVQGLVAYLKYTDNNRKFKLKDLRILLPVGEGVPENAVIKFHKLYPRINMVIPYGMTEFGGIIAFNCIDSKKVEMGGYKIASNSQAYILDENLKILPMGIPGEIYCAGDSLSPGYINDKKRTGKVFIKNPFDSKKKIFKTGDYGIIREDGSLKIIGRKDNQVKISGFRVELEEIEATLNSYKQITRSAVVFSENESEQKKLVAFYQCDEELNNSDIVKFLSSRLADYMIPHKIVYMDRIPLTFNGKIDRVSLAKIDIVQFEKRPITQPQNNFEHKIANVWSDVLKIKHPSCDDNFFDIGGDSLKMIELYSGLKPLFPVKISVQDVFNNRTIREQADLMANRQEKKQRAKIEKIKI